MREAPFDFIAWDAIICPRLASGLAASSRHLCGIVLTYEAHFKYTGAKYVDDRLCILKVNQLRLRRKKRKGILGGFQKNLLDR